MRQTKMWNRESWIRLLFGFLIAFSLFYFLVAFGMSFFTTTDYYREVIYSSYLSSVSFCQYDTIEEIESFLNIYNRTIAGYYSPSNDSIVLVLNDSRTNRHEQCHRQQNYESRSYGCEHPFFRFLGEIECNIKERNLEYNFQP